MYFPNVMVLFPQRGRWDSTEKKKGEIKMIRAGRNKKIVKLLAVVLMVILAFGLAACGKNGQGNDASGNAPVNSSGNTMEEVLLNAAKNISEAESLSYHMTMDMGLDVFGMSMDTLMEADAKTIQSPLSVYMDGTMDMGSLGSYGMEMYMVEEGGKMAVYTGMEMEEEKTWMKTEAEIDSSAITQYNAQSNIATYMENAKNFSQVGEEEINGVKTVRFDGIVTGESIEKVLKESGMDEQVAGMGVENVSGLYKDAGDIPLSFWVDTENEIVVQYQIDMGDVLKYIIDKTIEEAEAAEGEEESMAGMFGINKSLITVTVTGINNVDEIVVPEDVKANAEFIDMNE